MKANRIIAIISASANNEVTYKDQHAGFVAFEHPAALEYTEIEFLYRHDQAQLDAILNYGLALTGSVPLYLDRWVRDKKHFEPIQMEEITDSLKTLKRRSNEDDWRDVVTFAIYCMLQLSIRELSSKYDRKLSTIQPGMNDVLFFKPLFPLVESVYRSYFWIELDKYIEACEKTLSEVYRMPSTMADTRGRIFESMVIARLCKLELTMKDLGKLLNGLNTDAVELLNTLNCLDAHSACSR